MGFVIQLLSNRGKSYSLILAVTLIISFPLEFSQAWIVGRYPDITDVIGALTGALTGAVTFRRGYAAFRKFVAQAL